jgi:hypothetical protein
MQQSMQGRVSFVKKSRLCMCLIRGVSEVLQKPLVHVPDQDAEDLRALLRCMAANGLVPSSAPVQAVPIAPYVLLQTAHFNGRHLGFVPAGTQVCARTCIRPCSLPAMLLISAARAVLSCSCIACLSFIQDAGGWAGPRGTHDVPHQATPLIESNQRQAYCRTSPCRLKVDVELK